MGSRITISLNELGLVGLKHEKKSILSLHPMLNSMSTFSFPELCGISCKSHNFYNPSTIIFRSPPTMEYPYVNGEKTKPTEKQ